MSLNFNNYRRQWFTEGSTAVHADYVAPAMHGKLIVNKAPFGVLAASIVPPRSRIIP